MDFKSKKGSITIFVLVGLLFMSAFLVVSYASNVNKSKISKEQYNIISDIYSHKDGDENAYTRAYTALRKKNVQTFSFENAEDTDKTVFENANTVELTKTFDGNLSNYRIYGNSVQDATNGIPSPTNPVEIKSLGDKTTNNLFDINQIKKSNIKIVDDTLEISGYSNGVGIKPSKFLEMTGLKIGDTITTTRIFEVVKGKTASTGMVVFLHKVSGVPDVQLVSFNKNIGIATIPENFTDENFYGLYFYGTHPDDNGESLTIYRDFQIVKGSYTQETVPEYEPYGKYKIPVKVENENEESTITNIYLDEPLRKVGDFSDYIDFKNQKVYRIIKQGKIDNNTGIGKFGGVTDYSAFYFSKSDLPEVEVVGAGKYNVPIIANTFNYHTCGPANNNRNWSGNYQIGGSVYTTYKRICFTLPNTITSAAEAKTWLVDNPINYFYPSNEIIETSFEIPELEIFEDYTKIEVLTETPPSKIEVEYKGYTLD